MYKIWLLCFSFLFLLWCAVQTENFPATPEKEIENPEPTITIAPFWQAQKHDDHQTIYTYTIQHPKYLSGSFEVKFLSEIAPETLEISKNDRIIKIPVLPALSEDVSLKKNGDFEVECFWMSWWDERAIVFEAGTWEVFLPSEYPEITDKRYPFENLTTTPLKWHPRYNLFPWDSYNLEGEQVWDEYGSKECKIRIWYTKDFPELPFELKGNFENAIVAITQDRLPWACKKRLKADFALEVYHGNQLCVIRIESPSSSLLSVNAKS